MFAFGNIGECYDVARIAVIVGLVGNPHLNAVYAYTRQHCRQLRHRAVVAVAEVVCKEKVLVLVVIGNLNFVCGELCSTL